MYPSGGNVVGGDVGGVGVPVGSIYMSSVGHDCGAFNIGITVTAEQNENLNLPSGASLSF